MKNKWNINGIISSNGVKAFGCWEDITWCGENPQTVWINVKYLKEVIEILECMQIDDVYLTVSKEDQPLILSAERYKGGLIAIAPRIEE